MQTQSDKPKPSNKDKTSADVAPRVWQRPTLQRLHVSLDTAFTVGSGTDGVTETNGTAGPP